MKKIYIFIFTACTLGSFAQNTQKDSLSSVTIDEVVISSQTLFPNKKIDERASSHIHIYTKELQRYNYSDVNRVIMGKPGIHLVEEDGIGLRPNISIRGTGASRSAGINLMEDGVLIAPAPYIAPAAYYFPYIGRMAGVEILKGSGQIQYGPNTVGGTFNMISTQVPNKFSSLLDMSYGSFETKKIHTYAGDKIGKFGYLIEYFHNISDGFKNLPDDKDAGFNIQDAMIKLLYDNSNASIPSKLQFKIQTSKENSNETYTGVTREDFRKNPYQRYIASALDNMKTSHRQYLLSYEIKPFEKLQLNFDAYRNEFSRNWYKVNDVKVGSEKFTSLSASLRKTNDSPEILVLKGLYTGGDENVRLRNNNRKYISQGIQFNGQYRMLTTGLLRFGMRYHNDNEDRFQSDDLYKSSRDGLSLISKGKPGSQDNRLGDAHASSTYLQYQQELENFVITPGIRFEYIVLRSRKYKSNDSERTGTGLSVSSNRVNTIIPGISLLFKPAEKFNIFAGAHKGFRPPGIKSGQKAETSWNFELGTHYRDHYLDAEVVGYINEYSNMLGTDTNAIGGTNSRGDMYNVGEVSVKGLEAQLKYTINGKHNNMNFPIGVSYTLFSSNFKKDFESEIFKKVSQGFELPFIPKHQLNIEAGTNIGKFSLATVWKMRGEFRMVPGTGEIPENQKIPCMEILDASVRYNVNGYFTVYASGQNLLNKVHIASLNPAGLRPVMPRFVSLGVIAKL